jgi:hypothetical protein
MRSDSFFIGDKPPSFLGKCGVEEMLAKVTLELLGGDSISPL